LRILENKGKGVEKKEKMPFSKNRAKKAGRKTNDVSENQRRKKIRHKGGAGRKKPTSTCKSQKTSRPARSSEEERTGMGETKNP